MSFLVQPAAVICSDPSWSCAEGSHPTLLLCVQMQRTYRYNHRTGNMLPVMEGYKHSKKRPNGSAAKFAAGMPTDQPDSDDAPARDTDPMDQATHYPAVNHRAGPVKTSIKPPQFGTQD